MIDLFDIIIMSELKYGMFLSAGNTAFALKKKSYVLTLFSFSSILPMIIQALDQALKKIYAFNKFLIIKV